MLANNETGVIQDVAAVAERARAARAWMHTDAVQALGKIAVDFDALNVHAMTLSAHKIYGPKGAGALVVDKRIELRPLIAGGGHEQGMRSGTENVPAIVGFGAACELAASRMTELAPAAGATARASSSAGLHRLGAVIFGARAARMPNTSYFAFPRHRRRDAGDRARQAGLCAWRRARRARARSPSLRRRCWRWASSPSSRAARCAFSWARRTRAEQVDGFLESADSSAWQRLKGLTAMAV